MFDSSYTRRRMGRRRSDSCGRERPRSCGTANEAGDA
jgi:hypothetical protein